MISLQEALRRYQPGEFRDHLEAAERERAEVQNLFPLQGWPELPLEDYALGQNRRTYSWWLEFGAAHLGSIRGGASNKHLIYKKKDGGWFYNGTYANEQDAWNAIRNGFLKMFDMAYNGQWHEIDNIETISNGKAIRLKSLHLYFPEEMLPIGSAEHLRHFLAALGIETKGIQTAQAVNLSRMLLEKLRTFPELRGRTTNELERFLYWWNDPRPDVSQIIKIAPGEEGRYWDDCLANGYIRVGWEKVGDLNAYETESDFRIAFQNAYAERYKDSQTLIRKKADEVWTLRSLKPGDLIVANKGVSSILGIGTVIEPGYTWLPDVEEYNHAVQVSWDLNHAGPKNFLPEAWRFVTVAPVSSDLYQQITALENVETVKPLLPLSDPIFAPIAEALERKGQVILHGPPGTGKTFHALRFAEWWLAHANGRIVDARNTRQTPRRVWWVVANPKQWHWDQLFRDGSVDYRYGRLQNNYALVQPGDLVVGYLATPEKRIVALAEVTEGLHTEGDEPRITLKPLQRIENGLTYAEMLSDSVLNRSEPMRYHCQGTLFKLENEEADYLLSLLAERDPQIDDNIERTEAVAAAESQLTLVTFHPSYGYEDFIEGFRPQDSGDGLRLRLADGVFKSVCNIARANPKHKYLILIDEINRANLAKVFGEIITLMERDKRGVSVILPQSKEPFSVPENVYLLGTMNTSDRSIRLMDAALRRRFSFFELMPDMALLRGAKIDVQLDLYDYLTLLNTRISKTQGREKQIGHAFFLKDGQPISDASEFGQRFRQEILPLLQEYCYDDYAQLSEYVGAGLVDIENASLRIDVLYEDQALVAALTGFTSSQLGTV